MESRHHDLSVSHARLLTSGYMDPQSTGQMRPPYNELCRPPGTDASTLAAYHGRYLPSMPLSTGSSFPFLGGMYTGPPPTSPFRTPSTPGVNNMRQFWPPTPPPDGGYGRLALNTNLFPLFGASPDSGAFLTQGLVSRLGSGTHLSPLIDHKEHSFFSHGIGLGTPLTPNSHVTSPSPYPHLIPSLERHPVYGGHMTLGNKELEDEVDDGRLLKSHLDCLMKHDIPSSRPKSKLDGKNCCDKTVDDCCKLSQSCISSDNGKSHDEMQNISGKKQLHKVQPCKIEVSHSPTIKPDLLSPPIDSPRSDLPSPGRSFKKQLSQSPFDSAVVRPSYEETRCSQCCANIKDVATKLGQVEEIATSQPNSVTSSDTFSNNVNAEGNENESSSSSVIAVTNISDKLSFCKSNNNDEEEDGNDAVTESSLCKSNVMTAKHVTAAVIPTAPKQMIHREVHPEAKSVYESLKSDGFVKEQKGFCTDHCVKVEIDSCNEKTSLNSNNLLNSINSSFSNKPVCKNLATSCKVKDMIKSVCSAKQVQNSSLKSSEFDKTPPESPSPKAISSSAVSLTVSPTVMSKSPIKSAVKMQYVPVENITKCSPFKEEIPVMKNESANSRIDCEFSQKNSSKWSKAAVSPFTWQGNSSQDDQAINLTVSKKSVKPEPNESVAVSESSDLLQDNLKSSSEIACTSSSNVIGVCHPNPLTLNKMKNSSMSSVNNFASISVLNQPAEQSTEVHILHRSSKSSFPVVNRNGASPVPLKSTITANTSIHRSLKTERLLAKRGKMSELNHGARTTLATLAPKLSKNVNFGKDIQTSHTISASSSVSSTSIVFPATVNPCIPVGIAIAQQRQDSSTAASVVLDLENEWILHF